MWWPAGYSPVIVVTASKRVAEAKSARMTVPLPLRDQRFLHLIGTAKQLRCGKRFRRIAHFLMPIDE